MKPRIPHPLRDPACNLCDIVKFGYFHQLRLLICSGIQTECRDQCRRTPIMLCAFMEPEAWGVGTARTLIENGVRLDTKDKFGRNVLHYACIYERFGLIHVILKAIDFDLNQSDKLGNTALHYAAMSGNVAMTQVISRFFQRYKINPDKANKRGLTAAGEAMRLGNTMCARIIEHDRNSAITKTNGITKEPQVDPNSSSPMEVPQAPTATSNGTHVNGLYGNGTYLKGNGHLVGSSLRPLSASAAFLTRRDSTMSLGSVDERRSSYSFRSRSDHSRRSSHRVHQSPLIAMGIKKEDDVVQCADEKDFRNTPDFVFKLLHLHFDVQEWNPVHNLDSSNRSTAWMETGSNNQSQPAPNLPRPDWRRELKSLFKVYESQCSTSWRAAPKPPTVPPEEQEKMENEEEDRGKKSRRHSSQTRQGPGGKEQVATTAAAAAGAPVGDPRRRPSMTRVRRLSSVHGPIGKLPGQGPLDGNLDTSTESINSAVSAYKKRGAERETNLTGSRPENASSRTGLRRPSLEPSCPSSPCTSPTPPSNGANEQTRTHKRSEDKHNDGSIKNNNSNNNTTIKNNTTINSLSRRNSGSSNRSDQIATYNEKYKFIRRSSQESGSSKVSHKDNNNKTSTVNGKQAGPITPQISVPRVEESLIPDTLYNVQTAKLDTTRLWVQTPYDDNGDDFSEDDEEGGEDGVYE